MSRASVARWANISEQMNKFFMGRFEEAIRRDLTTFDEEGMFFLFCFEQGVEGFDNVMMEVMFEEMMQGLKELLG